MATNRMFRTLALTLALCVNFTPASAQVVYDDFRATSSLQFNGDTHIRSHPVGDALALTDEATGSVGSAFHLTPLDVTSFSTMFELRILPVYTIGGVNCGEPDSYADGMTFTITGSGPQSIGLGGERLAYEGILNSLAIEVDHWCNFTRDDPGSNHLGILENGSVTHAPGTPYAAEVTEDLLHNSTRWTVWVDYDGTTVEVRISGVGQRPTVPLLSKQVDIPALVGGSTAYVGFTAANGGGRAIHGVTRWEYRDYGDHFVLQPATPGLAGAVNDLVVDNLAPGSLVVFAASLTRRGRLGDPACPGLTLDLDGAVRLGVAVADAQGVATLPVPIPPQLAGHTVLFQAFERAACRVTNTVVQVFP